MNLSLAPFVAAQTPPVEPGRPTYRQQRSDEDWSFLRDESQRRDWWDPIKAIPLRSDREWYVTLGGELRPFFEVYDNYNWGAGPEDSNGFYLQRVMFHADLQMVARARAFIELKSGVETGRVGGSRPPDEDRLDVNQAFIDIRIGPQERSRLTFRLGRQEMDYGDGSLVSYREGPNVRRGYDGPKVMVHFTPWQVDAFVVRPVETDPGVFDDGWDDAQRFWGVYASAQEPILGILGRPELYYLGLGREGVRYDQGIDRETRHTVGARTLYQKGGHEYWLEGTFQFGSFGRGTIRAWKHVQVYAYTLDRTRLRPRLGLNFAISSGDKDPRDPDLQTYHPLFPRGLYYGYMDTSGSLNAIVLHPSTILQLSKPLSLSSEVFLFWRQRTTDGIYSQPGFFLRTGQQSDAHFVGTLGQVELVWRLDPHATATFRAGRYWVGEYFRDTPPARNMTYFSAKVSYKF
jgi:Alginate export